VVKRLIAAMTVRNKDDLLSSHVTIEEGRPIGTEEKPVITIEVQGRAVTHTAEGKPRLRVYEPKASIVLTADQFKKLIAEVRGGGW
jgi:hypothetical protein